MVLLRGCYICTGDGQEGQGLPFRTAVVVGVWCTEKTGPSYVTSDDGSMLSKHVME